MLGYMALEDDFEAAQKRVNLLTQRPANDELLKLYGLFKQATAGDVVGKRPGVLDFKGRAKYDAWASHKGQSKDDCMRNYVELVKQLETRYG